VATASTFSIPFVNTPAYFTGTAQTDVVPSVYPVAINGRPYLIDMKSGRYVRSHEQRVRDSQDTSTAPGEAAINPGGLWRRGQDSWHLGAGQRYADTAEAKDYMFYKSKGVNPWVKGQVSLLNTTVLRTQSTFSGTNLPMVEVNGYLYVGDGNTLKYTQDPFASSPTWTSVTSGAPAATAINDITTDGTQIYVSYVNEGILKTTIGGASLTDHYATSGGTYNYQRLGFAKGFVLGFHNDSANSHIHLVPFTASTSHGTATATLRDPNFVCAGFAGGQSHIYVAGRSTDAGLVYRLGIKSDGTVDVAIVALELPSGEYPTSIYGYLGFILLGTNKGVRYASADNNGNLVAGSLIPTTGAVNGFTAEERFVWFTYSNYDGISTGLGRLDLSVFISPNTPAHATDLMYDSTAVVKSVASFNGKRVFAISGVGVIVEDVTSVVASGQIETGTWRWGIPDRKFVAKFDVRTEPLLGSVEAYISNDHSPYALLGTFSNQNGVEYTYQGTDIKTIEADFKLTLTKGAVGLLDSPIVTRWMARAYAAPFRSEVFSIPVLLHHKIRPRDRDIYMNPEAELENLNNLINNPRIITLQLGTSSYSVIAEDVEFQPTDSTGNTWSWDGTATVTMRSVEN